MLLVVMGCSMSQGPTTTLSQYIYTGPSYVEVQGSHTPPCCSDTGGDACEGLPQCNDPAMLGPYQHQYNAYSLS